jgi:hypothetical protein
MVAYGAPLSVVLTSGPDGSSRLRQAIRLSFVAIKLNRARGLIVSLGAMGQAGIADLNFNC